MYNMSGGGRFGTFYIQLAGEMQELARGLRLIQVGDTYNFDQLRQAELITADGLCGEALTVASNPGDTDLRALSDCQSTICSLTEITEAASRLGPGIDLGIVVTLLDGYASVLLDTAAANYGAGASRMVGLTPVTLEYAATTASRTKAASVDWFTTSVSSLLAFNAACADLVNQ